MQVEADLIVFQLVAEREAQAVPLVGTDDQRLDGVALQAGGYGAGLMRLLLAPGRLVSLLLGADLRDVFGQDEHETGVDVQVLIESDLHGDR